MSFAGLYEFWRDPSRGDDDPARWLVSYTIITQQATDLLGEIHDRNPVVVPRELREDWLDCSSEDVPRRRAVARALRRGALRALRGRGRGRQRPQQRPRAHRARRARRRHPAADARRSEPDDPGSAPPGAADCARAELGRPARRPPRSTPTVPLPGSKSQTNRVLDPRRARRGAVPPRRPAAGPRHRADGRGAAGAGRRRRPTTAPTGSSRPARCAAAASTAGSPAPSCASCRPSRRWPTGGSSSTATRTPASVRWRRCSTACGRPAPRSTTAAADRLPFTVRRPRRRGRRVPCASTPARRRSSCRGCCWPARATTRASRSPTSGPTRCRRSRTWT